MTTISIPVAKLENNNGQIEGLPKNPRIIKDDKFKKLVKSLQDDPELFELRECLVYPHGKKYIVIAGNMRLKASQELGYTEVPCKILDKNITPDKLRAIAIKDNIPYGEHDWDALANEWDSVELGEWGLDVWQPNEDINLDDFFEESKDSNAEKNTNSIVLNYTEEEYLKVIQKFETYSESREAVIYKLLGL